MKTYLIYGDDTEKMREIAAVIRAGRDKAHFRSLAQWQGEVEACDGVALVPSEETTDRAEAVAKAYEGRIVSEKDFAKDKAAADKAAADKAAADKAAADKAAADKAAADKAAADKAAADKAKT